ncbi:DNA cytosine methyltransferase [Dyadobacter frigoris]|uniref:DNA (cytosine-5-)-methyltransferase n=1 Tax=Dyadobacter frigoris TaxID=2576211 RepID=A0A4U6DAH8_9BACT|nr:DNA (cytosine-5-)-methyltransferase [Dyadobacter frigoris]TKT93725.1 DNA (cytosine-5-)-methyltransferase [Dyadobacter frigoris]GLU51064.1 cytosine-specific methyltransferase [Dyadobacter frigoris]
MIIKVEEKISIKEQSALLNMCIENDLDLKLELQKLGLSYDHLRYKSYANNDVTINDYQSIENLRKYKNTIPAVSFFSGAGGMDIGFDYAGFENIASVEVNELFCDTLRTNYPNHLVIGPPNYTGDVKDREVIASLLQNQLGISSPFDGVFHGGPPCQPFSIASNQRFSKSDENFKRKGFEDKEKGNLLEDYIWFIKKFQPKAFIIENVPGLNKIDDGAGLNKLLETLTSIGYTISNPQVVNAADYGVPQKRLRLLIVGTRSKFKFEYPKISLFQTPCLDVFAKPINDSLNHITREHTAQSTLRYMELNFGQRDHLGRVDRLNPSQPSKTVIAGGTKGGGRSHLHPYSPRTLSVRECARLQTFPDDYIFVGPSARQFTQVGNAVPPLLAFKFATEIYRQFY